MFSSITNYDLGIIWGIGGVSQESDSERITFRHKDRYFLDRLHNYTRGTIYKQTGTSYQDQYVLKASARDFEQIIAMGWTPRNADIRSLPMLDDYKDFLRAYIELHSGLDYAPRRKKYRSLRLRVYGNLQLICGINEQLSFNANVAIKSINPIHNGKTAVLYHQSHQEIKQIYDYLYDDPCFEPYWQDVDHKLLHPNIPF